VTKDLIDTIYARHPDAEIGLAVFREVLYLDHRNNSLFKPLPGYGDQSYLPLTQLNGRYGGVSGVDAIKSVLQTETVTRTNLNLRRQVECVDLVYQPAFTTIGNTNINNAFAAAQEAMKTAKYPKEQQFIIFLSDGEPYPPNDPSQHGGKNPYYFTNGELTPTTFTVYLHNTETRAPASIQTMTQNIKANNYSKSNPLSDVWVQKTDYTSLMSLLMKSIMTPIFYSLQGLPYSLQVNNTTSVQMSGSNFLFTQPFPLKDSTPIAINFNYHLEDTVKNREFDSTMNIRFSLVRKAGAVLPNGMEMVCYDPGLRVYYKGTSVSYVTDSMSQLEVRFTADGKVFTKVEVDIVNAFTQPKDSLHLSLTDNGSYWSNTFTRSVGESRRNDRVLQHAENDSIIIIYRNPDVPSETVRLALPFRFDGTTQTNDRYTLTPYTINNPMTDAVKVPSIVQSIYKEKKRTVPETGTVLTLIPEGTVPKGVTLSGKVSIYDVGKNPVVENEEMVESNKRLYFVWDGKNSSRRKVATGTYLAIIEIFSNGTPYKKQRVYMGVKL
jgi:hypothetical protein